MKKLPIFITGFFLFIIALGYSFQLKTDQPPMLSFNDKDYAKAWKTIDSLEREGLPQSALEKVETLLLRARKDDNPSQTVKALLYRSKYQSQLEETGSVKAIARLEEEMQSAPFPVKSLLQSILAEAYNQYMQSNRWQIRERTNTVGFENGDVETWTIDQFAQKSMELYRQSVANPKLRDVDIADFNAITSSGNTDHLRPSLFDFLAHRAIDYFMNEQSYLAQPTYRFYLDDPVIFASAKEFASAKFAAKDTTSGKYNALILLQELVGRHLNDSDPSALADVDLKRLKFAYDNAVLNDKDDKYVKALQLLIEKYNNSPAQTDVYYQLAQYHRQKGGEYRPSQGDKNRWEYKKAVEICEKAIAAFPDSHGGKACRNLKDQLEQKAVQLTTEKVNIPDHPFLVKLDIRNVNKIWLRVAKVDADFREKLQQTSYKKRIGLLQRLNPIHSWTEEWTAPGDYHTHALEVKIPALPVGQYVVIASANAEFDLDKNGVAFAVTYLSNIAHWWQQEEDGGGQYVVVNRKTGKPLQGVQATFYEYYYHQSSRKHKYKKAGTAQSDKNGIVRPNLSGRNSFKVVFQQGADVLDLDDNFNNYRNSRTVKSQQVTEFFLDRKIYRPGQTIYFKALALEKDGERMPRILSGEKIEVIFYDANHQEVERKTMVTNDYGTVHGSFTAPKSGLLGQMSIRSTIGRSSVRFSVEEYKRPKFEVNIDQLDGSYRLGDELTVTGLAKAYAGSAIDGAKVSYRVVRNVSYPYFPWWRYGYYFRPWGGQAEEIAFGETTTGPDGTFTIPFVAKPDKSVDPKDQPVFTYQVTADVVDITGETHSATGSVTIGYVALKANVLLEEQMERDSFKKLTVSTKNFSGSDEPARGKIVIRALQNPKRPFVQRYWNDPDIWLLTEEDYNNDFPQFAYKGADKIANWKTGREVANLSFDTGSSKEVDVSQLNFPAGAYFLELTTTDKYDNPIEVRKYFKLFDLDDQELPYDAMQFHHQNKSAFEPGETVQYYIGSAAKPVHIFHQIEHKGKIEKEEWLTANALEKLTMDVVERHRGNLHYGLYFVRDNRFFQTHASIVVPFSNKELTVELATFRDKLYPGADEEWRVKISGPNKDQVAAEMVAAMYDASLDVFRANHFTNYFYPTYHRRTWVNTSNFQEAHGMVLQGWGSNSSMPTLNYRSLNWFGLYFNARRFHREFAMMNAEVEEMAVSAMPSAKRRDAGMTKDAEADFSAADTVPEGAPANGGNTDDQSKKEGQDSGSFDDIAVRTNLHETVFFLPDLQTDGEGNIIFSFKMNEALTRWKFLGFAHTKDLKTGTVTQEVVTQKDLMVMPNAPRFFREGDQIIYTAKVSNLTENKMDGSAQLLLFDALTNKPVNDLLGLGKAQTPFVAEAGQSALLEWKLQIPFGEVMAITHRVVARAGNFSDGEESAIPVLTNRMLVTETMPLPVRGKQSKDFNFTRLASAKNSNTLKHHKLTLEFTSNPAWYAVQALPYMMEYPYDCTEQIFNRYYANSLATSVANAHPKVKKVFDRWRNTDAMLSNLSKNQELKSALLEETPWVLQAQSEEEQKKSIGLLFDLQRMADEQAEAIAKITERQSVNGGFAWFPGGRDSWYITQYIVEGMGHLDALGVSDIAEMSAGGGVLHKAVNYIDDRLVDHYNKLKERVEEGHTKWEDDHLDYMVIHYLYARSFFTGQEWDKKTKKIVDYYLGQTQKYWVDKGIYMQGMLALAMHRNKDTSLSAKMIKSFKERALQNDELGMYWKYDRGYFWHELPIETHALMIEVFDEVANDQHAVDDLKVWLLKNKQTTHWKTTKATAAAVYALLRRGANWLLEDQPVKITLGGKKVKVDESQMEAGTGYFKTNWEGNSVEPKMASVTVENPNSVVAWGAMYWQYFEDLDKITTFEETPLTLKKQLFKERNTDRGPVIEPITTEVLQPGDKIKVRIELRVDRPMEYVHMKDMRASGFEPVNVLSSYKWQDGLGYYESTRDASTNFFFSYLPKGTYVFEYPLRVNHRGDFSNGITTIQCMYAPEFTSHSEGVRVQVK